MITRKELSYVNSWANRVPYPGKEYCEIAMDKLTECVDLFLDTYAGRKYVITFSNLDEIELEVKYKNICHMLGIDFKNLSGEYFKDFRSDVLSIDPEASVSSFELLKSIISNKDKVLKYDETNTTRSINYYKVSIKADIFKKLADLSQFNYGCINFNKDRFVQLNPSTNFSSNSTKFLYTSSDESVSPYFLMGLRKEENNEKNDCSSEEEAEYEKNTSYIVETLIAPELISNFFNSQEVIIPTQILTDLNGTLTKTSATPEEKIRLLKEYRAIVSQYDLPNTINIYGDYLSCLKDAQSQKQKTIVR